MIADVTWVEQILVFLAKILVYGVIVFVWLWFLVQLYGRIIEEQNSRGGLPE